MLPTKKLKDYISEASKGADKIMTDEENRNKSAKQTIWKDLAIATAYTILIAVLVRTNPIKLIGDYF